MQKQNDSSEFIEFSLSAILETVEAQAKHQGKHKVDQLSEVMLAVLKALESKSLSRNERFVSIGLNNDYRAFKRNVEPLLIDGYLEMTVPDKPRSKLQKYRLTNKGNAMIDKQKQS